MLSCFLGLHLCWLSGRMCISLRGIHFLRGVNLPLAIHHRRRSKFGLFEEPFVTRELLHGSFMEPSPHPCFSRDGVGSLSPSYNEG